MRVNITDFTKAIKSIKDLTAGDKVTSIPGVLLDLNKSEDGTALLKVCYSNGAKNFIQEINVVTEECDTWDMIAVDFGQIDRIVTLSQPSGMIVIDELCIRQNEKQDDVMTVTVEQFFNIVDGDGNLVDRKSMATKNMDLSKLKLDTAKTELLTRPKKISEKQNFTYDEILAVDNVDELDKEEFIDIISRLSAEQNQSIYLGKSSQKAFVNNKAHITEYNLSKNELTEEDLTNIRAELENMNQYTDENFENVCQERRSKIKSSYVIQQQLGKALISIINRTKSDKIYISNVDGDCNFYVDTDEDRVGCRFKMPLPNNVHMKLLNAYLVRNYTDYQISFMREFLVDMIKSALNETKNDSVELKFKKKVIEEIGKVTYVLVINGGSASASTADVFELEVDDVIDTKGDLDTKSLNISLKLTSEMLAQLKTDRVALDIEIGADNAAIIRLAEIDDIKQYTEYTKARQGLADNQPTPVESKLGYRINTLGVKQYTTLKKSN